MAITTEAGLDQLDSQHLEPEEFDGLLNRHGSPCEIRIATPCGCWQRETGQPDPGCTVCYPLGFLWDEAPIVTKTFGPNRRPMRRPDAEGTYELGDASFTFQTGITPTPFSRILLPLSVITVADILTKGSEDTIRFAEVLGVERALYTRRTPPTGAPYTNETVELAFSGATPDLTVNGRTVTWVNTSIPDGTRYVLRLRTRAEYVVLEPQDRNEGGRALPYRYLCRRYDFLLHPRDTKQVSF